MRYLFANLTRYAQKFIRQSSVANEFSEYKTYADLPRYFNGACPHACKRPQTVIFLHTPAQSPEFSTCYRTRILIYEWKVTVSVSNRSYSKSLKIFNPDNSRRLTTPLSSDI